MMNKYNFLLLLFFPIVVFSQKNERTKNFPKQVEHVQEMPDKENLWIFVMAGQSNMEGRGFVEPGDTLPSKRIITLNKENQWVYAKEPLHYYSTKLVGLDCGMSFAKTMEKSLPENIVIGLVPCAVGGSAIQQWLGDSLHRDVHLLSNFRHKTHAAKEHGVVKGILWHQGESDSGPERSKLYYDNLGKLTTVFRKHIGNEQLPIFIGELGRFGKDKETVERRKTVSKISKKFARNNDNTYFIPSKKLVHKGDLTHFDGPSQREIGKRFAMKYLKKVFK